MIHSIAVPKQIKLPTGMPVGAVNAYLFEGPIPILIDTGIKSEESLAALRAGLNDYGLTIADLRQIIISHSHVDHCGLAGTLVAESGAIVHTLTQTIPWLTDFPTLWQKRLTFYRHLFTQLGLPAEVANPILTYFEQIEAVSDTVPLDLIIPFEHGDTITMGGADWQIIHTPGHCSNLVCFYQAETEQLLSTDMLLPLTPTPIVESPPNGKTERQPSLPDFINSLNLINTLPIKNVYPGHGKPFQNAQKLINTQLNRIQQRKKECLQYLQEGNQYINELLLKMYPDYPPAFRFAGLWMVLGYLDLLEAEGAIIVTQTDGILTYQPSYNY